MRTLRIVFAIGMLAIVSARPAAAQQEGQDQESRAASLEGFEGRHVSKITIAIAPGENVELARSLIAQKAGQPLSREAIQKSVATLQQHPEFRQVQVSIEPDADGLRVVFLIQPVYRVGLISFPGAAEKISYSRLLQAANFTLDGPFVADDIAEKEEALKKFLTQEGYFVATVQTKTNPDVTHQLMNVSFECTLGKRAKVGDIRVTGVSTEESEDIKQALNSFWAKLSSTSLKPGQSYSKSKVDKALDHVRAHLTRTGRLSPNVRPEATYDEATNRVNLALAVTPGPLVTIRVEGARIWKRTMRKLIPIFQEGTVDQDLIDEGRRNLLSYFQSKSYFNASVAVSTESDADHMTITYHLERGTKHKVAHVLFTNNRYFDDRELQGRIAIEKERFPFYRGKYSEQLLRKSVDSLAALYRREGFADVKIATNVTDDDPTIDVEFVIQEGEQNKVHGFEVLDEEGNAVKVQMGRKKLALAPGKPYSPYYLNDDRSQILASYLNRGYPDVTMNATATPSSENQHLIDVTFKVTTGQLVRTGNVVLLGTKNTKPGFVRSVVRQNVQAGQPLGQNRLLRSESDLYTLGIFDWASVSPLEQNDNPDSQQVLVRVHESKRNTLDIGGGLEVIPRNGNLPFGTVAVPGLPPVNLGSKFTVSQKSFVGPRGSVQVARHNILGRAETASIAVVVSRLDQRATFSYSAPDLAGTRWSSVLSVNAERTTENPIFTAAIGQASFQVERNLNQRKTQKIIARYSYGRTDLSNITIPDLVLPQDRNVRLSTVSAEYIRDTRDKPLDAHHGQFQSLNFSVTPTIFGSSANFVKFLGQTSFYHPIRPWLTWANNVRLGLAPPFANSRVPLSESFFSGGPNTLRGFAINGAGPQRPVQVCSNPADSSTCTIISVPVGGKMLAIFNSEARFPIPVKKGWGGVLFYDGGNVYQNINFRQFADNYTNSIGFGLRYDTKVGPVRIDVARRLTNIPGVKATQYFITLGQSF
jgi:outer membrane protein insertion porin family